MPLIQLSMRIIPNATVTRQAFAPVPYPGMIPALSKLLALRIHETAMVLLVIILLLLGLPVVPPSQKRRSTVNVTLYNLPTLPCSL